MLVPGSLSGGHWVEAVSLARTIEEEMVAAGLLDLDEEQPDAQEQRRKTFIVMATAIVRHFKENHQLVFSAGDFGQEGASGTNIPSVAKTLTGKLS